MNINSDGKPLLLSRIAETAEVHSPRRLIEDMSWGDEVTSKFRMGGLCSPQSECFLKESTANTRKYMNEPSGSGYGLDMVRKISPWDALRTMMDSLCKGLIYNFLTSHFYMLQSAFFRWCWNLSFAFSMFENNRNLPKDLKLRRCFTTRQSRLSKKINMKVVIQPLGIYTQTMAKFSLKRGILVISQSYLGFTAVTRASH